MEVEVKIEGLAELDARLAELGALAAERLLRRVLRKTAEPLQRAAARNAQQFGRSNSLAASVRTVAVRAPSDAAAKVAVGPRKSERTAVFVHNAYYNRRRKGIFHGHFLEFGHRIGSRKGNGSGGSVRAQPWLQPAVSSASPLFVPIFESELRRALDRVARRRGSRSANPDAIVPP